jgi:hypothetical protein
MNDNWAGTREQFENETLPKLRIIGKEIGLKAKEGLQEAIDIINCYEMIRRSFDPVAFILLEEAIKKYETLQNQNAPCCS